MIWGRQLSDRELLDDNSIDVLFGAAVRCGFARDDEPDRQRFAALVVNIRRTKAKSRAGLLTCVIEGRVINKHVAPGADPRDWRHRATDADRDEARRILKRIDGIAGPAQTSTPAANLETDAHEWRERERQLAAIANFKVGSTS